MSEDEDLFERLNGRNVQGMPVGEVNRFVTEIIAQTSQKRPNKIADKRALLTNWLIQNGGAEGDRGPDESAAPSPQAGEDANPFGGKKGGAKLRYSDPETQKHTPPKASVKVARDDPKGPTSPGAAQKPMLSARPRPKAEPFEADGAPTPPPTPPPAEGSSAAAEVSQENPSQLAAIQGHADSRAALLQAIHRSVKAGQGVIFSLDENELYADQIAKHTGIPVGVDVQAYVQDFYNWERWRTPSGWPLEPKCERPVMPGIDPRVSIYQPPGVGGFMPPMPMMDPMVQQMQLQTQAMQAQAAQAQRLNAMTGMMNALNTQVQQMGAVLDPSRASAVSPRNLPFPERSPAPSPTAPPQNNRQNNRSGQSNRFGRW